MEHSISALAYKGSITDAITEAKRQKKLFVVYISGDSAESNQLDESTWMDSNVADSMSKYCILLHISEGSTDAANFFAIYPQKSAPCITAIGYNGAQLWQNEGFVNADILASSLEKAWLSLHIQETTATFLTAALASNKSEPHGTNSSNAVSFERGSSSSMDVPSPSADKHPHSFEAMEMSGSERENKGSDHADEGINPKLGNEASPGSDIDNVLEVGKDELSISSVERAKQEFNRVKVDQNDIGVDHDSVVTAAAHQSIANEATEGVQDKKANAVEEDKIDLNVKPDTSQMTAVRDKTADAIEDDKIEALESCSSSSTDVHLNIRLLDGASLQEKFLVTDTLRMVKDYVDENQATAIGSYDLAIPYPRKVFNDQDLNKTLAELGLLGRHALIVVRSLRATGYPRGGSSTRYQTNSITVPDSSNGSNEGYLAFIKRILSYANPFTYLGGGASSSNAVQEPQRSTWQYSPNPALQNDLRGTGRPSAVDSSSQTTPQAGRNDTTRRQATSSRFGSNIHTLKHDEEDSRFRNRNAFWNGNNTEYGGDNDDGK